MATTTATPLDTKAEAKAAKKAKEPKPPFQRTLAGQEGLGPTIPAAAGIGLHDHPDPDAVRGDVDHLVHELGGQLSQRDRLRDAQQLRAGLH